MATYVLVHGAWHGSWCWDRIAGPLRDRGNTVIAVDLPGRADKPVPAGEITLDRQVEYLASVIDQQDEPVILVGHSLGGNAITQVAEKVPSRIRTLVYLAACLLPDGKNTFDVMPAGNASFFVPSEDGLLASLDKAAKPVLCNCCTEEDAEWVFSQLCPEAFAVNAPMRTTEENFGSVPRVYIETLQDLILPLEVQRQMVKDLPCEKVFSLDTGHSAFLSKAKELIDILQGMASD